jgi:hypothetical protein
MADKKRMAGGNAHTQIMTASLARLAIELEIIVYIWLV